MLSISYKKISNSLNNNIFYCEPSDDYNLNLENASNENEGLPNISFETEITPKYENKTLNWYLTKEVIDKFNRYTNSCINNKLLSNKKYPLLKNPKITAIIPLHNAAKYLYYSLRSIQNQKLKEIEIVLIDDCSTDDTIKIVEEYMKEDERIRLIINEKNRKILYSKSIAALNARGKYIIQLDQDDLFIRDDIFDILYYQAEKHNLDLVQIRDICKDNFVFKNPTKINYKHRHFIFQQKTHYKTQPELKDTMFIEGNNYLLWGLLIKTDIYKRTIYHLWPIIINYKMTFQEDYMITSMLVILAQRYRFLNLISLIHFKHKETTTKTQLRYDNYLLGILFQQYILYEYYIKNNPQDMTVMINFMNHYRYQISFTGTYYYRKLYNHIMHKINDNEYLSDKHKKFLKDVFSQKNQKEFEIWNIYDSLGKNKEYETIYNYQNSILVFNNKTLEKENKKEIKVSIVIIYSEYNYIENTINSIEHQTFIDYEIIIVFDNNDKYNLDLINSYIKNNNFMNIKLISNGKNDIRGYLNSVSKGVLSSKGKYILVFESSYTFAKATSLEDIYTLTTKIKNPIDILEFNLLVNSRHIITKSSLSLYKCLHMKSNIDLHSIKYNNNTRGIDQHKELLVNKLIKADLFKKIINKYKFNEIQRKVFNYYEDIILFALKNVNCTFYHIDIFGVMQNINNLNSLNVNNIIKDKNRKIKDTIFYINFLYENSLNTFEEKKIAVQEFFNVMNIIYNKFTKISKESYNLYRKFINSYYINKEDKNILQLYYNSLTN